MRVRKKEPDFGAISKRSINKDFKRVQRYQPQPKRPEIKKEPEINSERRINFVNENSAYFKLRGYVVGKLVRLIEKTSSGWRCAFVHDDDRKALNAAAGWSDRKHEYIFDCVKWKE